MNATGPGRGGQETAADPAQPLLAIEDLTIEVGPRHNRSIVVEDLSLVVAEGEVLGLAGESGSGKTMTALSIAGLAPRGAEVSGSIRFRGEELLGASPGRLRMLRGREIGFVFQDATASLHPSKRVGAQVAEVVKVHEHASRHVAWQRSLEMLEIAGIPNPAERAKQYPYELSGGLQQRVAVAIALAGRPSLLIADEPTTALDTTVQAQMMDRLEQLQAEFGLAVLFISHDLALISEFCERVVIMYSSQVVEDGAIDEVFPAPEHPYTELLLGSVLGGERLTGPRAVQGARASAWGTDGPVVGGVSAVAPAHPGPAPMVGMPLGPGAPNEGATQTNGGSGWRAVSTGPPRLGPDEQRAGSEGPTESAGPGQSVHRTTTPTTEGCRFAPRCPYAIEPCEAATPPLEPRHGAGHVRCIRHEDLALTGVRAGGE
jgi:ABC-type dipeptide/oligopeptide/nickel transport system ATPase component